MRILPLLAFFILLLGCAQPEQAAPPAKPASAPPATSPADTTTDAASPPPADDPQVGPEAPPEAAPPPASALESEEVSYNSFGWEIHGTLYEAKNEKNPTKAVMLVPMMGETRESYPQSFIERVHDEMPEATVLAIDARGHGESDNLGTYDQFDLEQWKGMSSDIVNVKRFLAKDHPTVKEYYVVGASIGSTAAILAGKQENDITKIAMLSPGMEYKDIDIERAVDDYVHPLFVAATAGDSYSANSATMIESMTSAKTTLKIYQGSSHGTGMFDETSLLSDLMVFLK